MPQPPIATEKLDAIGLDAICGSIAQGNSMTAIAFEAGVSIGSFLNWISADGERSARVREIRIKMALHWDERAEAAIAHAGDEFELKKAREIAHHYRWRAAKIAPRDYGDKVEVQGSGKDGAVLVQVVTGVPDDDAAG
jgi:hypothetical protein